MVNSWRQALLCIWVHTASLGEFEQGLPVIKALRKQGYKVLVTFFS
ncbi:MAG: glycosyltransferase N-terminal domain-containing protein, partial [Neisseria sp.]